MIYTAHHLASVPAKKRENQNYNSNFSAPKHYSGEKCKSIETPYLFGKYAVIRAFDYFGIFIHIQSRIHFNGCWLTIIKIAIIGFWLTFRTLSLWTIRSLFKSKRKLLDFNLLTYGKINEISFYLLTFRILKWAQSNVAFVINGCRVWKFMCWKCDWCFGTIACILELSHDFTIQWASNGRNIKTQTHKLNRTIM